MSSLSFSLSLFFYSGGGGLCGSLWGGVYGLDNVSSLYISQSLFFCSGGYRAWGSLRGLWELKG